ncbi:MAG: hypothetical protein AB7O26_12880 [Planctomycetaceae bacterium]
MPRVILFLNEGEPREVGGVRVTARVLRSSGRRIRVIVDLPPQGRTATGGQSSDADPIPPTPAAGPALRISKEAI